MLLIRGQQNEDCPGNISDIIRMSKFWEKMIRED